ncbi:MAG: hypothetical protein K0S55_1025, partial [Clostridia bacterium]|nr:hypothetical protein [Clostridia bacterium]
IMDDKMYEISSQLAQNGVKAEKVEIKKDKLILGFASKEVTFNPEDLLTVRNALTALRKISLTDNYNAFSFEVLNSSNNIVYSKLFKSIYDITNDSDNIQNEVIDKTLTGFKIKYALVKSNIENLGIKVFSSSDNNGKIANIKVKTEKISLDGVLRCVTDIISETNEQGGGIYCYNIQVVDENNLPIYMISKDLYYVDEIIWAA